MAFFVRAFPLWVLAASLLALAHPPSFSWFLDYGLVGPGLQIIMLGMGLTLKLDDFRRVAESPKLVLLGVGLQYTVMPLSGWFLADLFALPDPLAIGLILVCACPGGTASNVVAYLARADVALSVSMTALSTLLAVLLTPLLTTLLVGDRVEVDAFGLFVSTIQVVIAPIIVGLALRRYLPRVSAALLPIAPPAAVLMIVLIVAAILGREKASLLEAGLRLPLAVASAHFLGFALGYGLGRLQRQEAAARTIAIEVGMQNSGLGAQLARANFVNPMVAIPSALSALFHCIIGSALAAIWSRVPPSPSQRDRSSS